MEGGYGVCVGWCCAEGRVKAARKENKTVGGGEGGREGGKGRFILIRL